MRPAVLQIFPAFSTQYEGRVPHMYCDVLGLITIGIGCLIDPVALARRLPFIRADGAPASPQEVEDAWQNLKQHADEVKQLHYRHHAELTGGLRLTDTAVDHLMIERLVASERWLRRTFPAWDAFPADAQLGIVSMAWAAGANFTADFHIFTGAARNGDWATCAHECRLREAGNPGLVPRNLCDHWLFMAASVADSPYAGLEYPDEVHWGPRGTPGAVW